MLRLHEAFGYTENYITFKEVLHPHLCKFKMASKPSHSKETMVTRFKSAQQRRLRPMDRSMTALTKLLKSPERKPKERGESIKKSPKTSLIKGQKQSPRSGSIKSGPPNPKLNSKVASIVEYYPNKLKRHVLTKKIVLKPNNNLKIVAKTSRRKFGTPHKGIRSPISSPKQSSESSSPAMSINEVIRVFEETHELDDDDLMEILTCPSPVWWEDPPDSTYIEDPIGERTLPDVESKLKENHVQSKPTTDVPKTNLDINLQDKDINFKSKRSKLEGLLNNLKGKININKHNISNKGFDTSRHKEAPTVSSNELNQPKQNDGERKSCQNSVLRTKENKRKIIKIARRDKILIAPKNKGIKRNSKRIVKNIFKSNGNIKVKNPDEINKELQENMNIKKDDSTSTENDGEMKYSEIEKKIQNINEKEQRDLIHLQDKKEEIEEVSKNDLKDMDDNVMSDNPDLSEIIINEELLCHFENINIPIGDSSVCRDKDLETTKISDDDKNIDKVETCQKVAGNETTQKQGNDSGVENSELVINPNAKEFNGDNDSTDSKEPFIEQDTTATSSSTADIEEKTECNNTLINLFDEKPSYDSHEFDLQFENAILGLENTVLRPGKFKKRAKLCTKPDTNKDLKLKEDIKLEVKNKMSSANTNKTEAVNSTKVVIGKRKNTNSTDEGKNVNIKTETPDSSETKVRRIEDVSQRGRVRRRKAHFDYKNDMTKTLNIKKEISDDVILKCPQVLKKPTQNKPQKIKKRKKAQISSEDTKKDVVLNTEVKEPSNETTENIDNVDDISKRGRIRRKKVPFTDDKPYNDIKTLSHTKTKRKYQKHKTVRTKSQIIIPQKKYYNKNKPNSCSEVYLQPNKKPKTEEQTDIVDYVLNDLETKLSLTKNKNSKLHLTNNISTVPGNCINSTKKDTETIELKGFDMKLDNTTSTTSVHNSETDTPTRPETLKLKEPLDNKTQTFLSVFKKYGENRSINVVDSISDSGVTFIDESNVENSKRHKHIRSNSKTYIAKRMKSDANNIGKTQDTKEIDDISNEGGLNVPNLGPNYKSVSPKQQKDFSPEKQNEQIVLNTESKKLVTVQSDKELFDNSNDIETITVFKIIPKEIE
ncbi:hypothetical protein K1T71_000650 [Dendrolimus kikuchii]|uniref:Uncharacterized protein n=1 Tax=Dendrolimus kikuchii TaxID=765133 RepID=A0ACC1DKN8_9NEOP|nr:hypothetical protein K1T71_000650 [Dendrolimus kikuchii]